MITSAINLVLAMTGMKREQRTFQVLSKEGYSKKETTAVLFNLLLRISCFLCGLYHVAFPSHTDVTLQVSFGSCPNISRICEKRPLVAKLMTCKMDKLKHQDKGCKTCKTCSFLFASRALQSFSAGFED